ncbi:siderophore-interacting protein [Chitinophaga sedimenti]|uniref:siderophore-interacting protein n=1 Tax=Chitinophaga sedimenti TaxID=2033606 RepID=UPI0020041F28|nr:siderophore-interacting protein [Chitinophaga sedimenti]MCK7554433.1 siderophore-interacting protein [Chitinophaga sedimenti]
MNIIKKAATSLLESAFAREGRILSVKSWQPDTVFELEVHFPEMSMSKWTTTQHMKVKVAEGAYRDYTPTMWNAAKQTCTLVVDAVHDGPGSRWARRLRAGDALVHLGVASALDKPELDTPMFAMGDLSALGHFTALRQLAAGQPVQIAVEAHAAGHESYLRELHVTPVASEAALLQWWRNQQATGGMVYLAGNMRSCINLRKTIKAEGFNGRVRAHGFWK